MVKLVDSPLGIVVGAGWVVKLNLVATTSAVRLEESTAVKLLSVACKVNISWSAVAV